MDLVPGRQAKAGRRGFGGLTSSRCATGRGGTGLLWPILRDRFVRWVQIQNEGEGELTVFRLGLKAAAITNEKLRSVCD
jgi:hypothetical protein